MCFVALSLLAGILWRMWAMPVWGLAMVAAGISGVGLWMNRSRTTGNKSPASGKKTNRKQKYYLVFIFALMEIALAIGYSRYDTEAKMRTFCEPYLQDGACIQLQGRIYKKENKNQQILFYLDQVILRVDGKQFPTHSTIVTFADGDYPIGKTITISGTMKVPEPATNDGNYDARNYYHSLNMDYLVKGESVLGVYGKTDRMEEGLFQFKEKLKEKYTTIFSEETAGIMTTMLLGDKELLDKETKEIYQQAGVAHILTISGLHISLFGMFVYRLLRRKASFSVAGIGSAIILALYVVMIGAGISAKRALVMFFLLILGQILGRSYDSLTGLSLAVMLLLWENPFLISHVGFQFSVIAVLGATYVREKMTKILQIWKRRGKKLWNAVVAAVSIQLMTLPLVAFYYYEIPVYAVFLNILVTNLLSFVLIYGITCGILGFISLGSAEYMAVPLELVLRGITGISSGCLRFPGAVYQVGVVSPGRIAAYYVTFFLALHFLFKARMKYEERRERAKERPQEWVQDRVQEGAKVGMQEGAKAGMRDRVQESVQGRAQDSVQNRVQDGMQNRLRDSVQLEMEKRIFRRRICFGEMLSLVIMLLLLLVPEKNQLLCAVLDVGQGDGIYLQPEEGVHVFIDGGSSDVGKVGQYRILPFLKYHRITSIDYWFVSHYDGDHVNGLLELLEDDYRVKNLLLPYEEPDNENYQQLLEVAEKSGTKVVFFSAGSMLEIGSCNIRALLPDPNRSVDAGDANENCMVLYVTHSAGNMIFTGDAGVEDEQWILLELAPVKLLKVGHHGSKYSSSEEFLQVLSPEYAVISCSSTNRYGHPHAETVERLDDIDCEVFRTDWVGQISITVDGAGESWGVESKN